MWTHCVDVLCGGGQVVGSGAAAARCAQSINATNILVPERPRDDDRREYDETDRVDPGIIRRLAVTAAPPDCPGPDKAVIDNFTVTVAYV